MYRRNESNQEILGVLNDYDLASTSTESPQSNRRTGTKPFIAIDLLDSPPPPHLYRHDLESLLYVIIWVTSRYHNGAEIENPPFQEWATYTISELKNHKISLLTDGPVPVPTANFSPLWNWTSEMCMMFADGRRACRVYQTRSTAVRYKSSAKPPAEFNYETHDDHVTFQKFGEIMDQEVV
jgi:hypothetical protein